jgi:hypothetical protein
MDKESVRRARCHDIESLTICTSIENILAQHLSRCGNEDKRYFKRRTPVNSKEIAPRLASSDYCWSIEHLQ